MKNSKFKKLIGKKSTGVIIAVVALVIVLSAIFSVSNLTLAKDSLPGIVDIRNDIAESDAAYTVLEIVPNLEVSEFGYLVGGQEPLDVETLYDSTTKDWITWQEYLTKNTENMTTEARVNYMNQLVANNIDYIGNGAKDPNKPMWYETYNEYGVTAETEGAKVLYGGNTPVYGWLISDDLRGTGWNAKFSHLSFNDTYDSLVASKTPYYIVDASKTDATVALDEDKIKNDIYPSHYYTYKKDVTDKYFEPAVTIGELKAMCEADNSWYAMLSEYYVVKFKVLESTDYTYDVGPVVYEASEFVYLDTNAPYVIPNQTSKGHQLQKPSNNIYYTGGLYNNEMFKMNTLDIDETDIANYNVEVLTVTAGEINAMSRDDLIAYLSNVDFVYLNAGDSVNTDISNDKIYTYLYSNSAYDLDDEAVELLFEKICNEKLPCIVDANLVEQGETNSDLTNTRAFALACMLLQPEYRNILTDGEFDISKIAIGSSMIDSWRSTVDTTNSCNYVNGNVMAINSTLIGYGLTDNYYNTPYSAEDVLEAYQAVLDEIELENLYRAADQTAGYDSLDTNIYKATAVRYIINYVSARTIEVKTLINVLEIQPAKVQYAGTLENNNGGTAWVEMKPSTVRAWMGVDDSVSVNITTMTTNEFVGRIEDINSEYDLIYIGGDVYGMPGTDSKTNIDGKSDYWTNFSDNNMDGMIYTNVGDLKGVKSQFLGQLATDYENSTTMKYSANTRFSGNDISADKHNALVDYMKGTYPIVVSDKLSADNLNPSKVTLDDCSYLYSFLKENLDEPNVFTVREVKDGNNSQFKFYANRAKLSIGKKVSVADESDPDILEGETAFVVPGAKKTGEDPTDGHVTFLSEDSNGKYILKYKFTITNNGAVYDSTRYKAALYLDSNADGKYSVEYEGISDITLTHVASNKTVENGALIAGEQYALTREVPATYSELLNWKVEVSQADNPYIRDSVIGHTKIKKEGKTPEKIKVLHVYKDHGGVLNLEKAIGNTESYNGNNDILEALVWGGKVTENNETYSFPGIKDDFMFEFTSIRNCDFNDSYAEGYLYRDGKKVSPEQKFNLMDYDMFVLGFYDSYNIRSTSQTYEDIDEVAINGDDGIKEFIDSGKSVLFAHDTTSFISVSATEYKKIKVSGTNDILYDGTDNCSVWAYTLNKNIRDMVGLDAYGVSLKTKNDVDYSRLASGVALKDTDDDTTLMDALTNKLDENGHYKIGLKSLAYKPGSDKKETVPEVQGLSYSWAELWDTNGSVHYRRGTNGYKTVSKAERVNEGQITTYPYYVPQEIGTATTHSQYFFLDLNADDDGDGETDLVVWYTLKGDTVYESSPRDVVNNYYIYNKGNITYTGIGHSGNSTTVQEGKLFINTMVAAYSSGRKEPQITVYESENNLVPTNTFYEYGDVDNEVAFRENSQRMYFSVNDLNVIRGDKSASAKYYVKLKASAAVGEGVNTYTADGVTYPVYKDESGAQFIQLTNLVTKTAAGVSVDANKLECGVVHYVDIPTTVFDIPGVDGQNVNSFMVIGQTTLIQKGAITGKETVVITDPTKNVVDFVHVELFPLD